MATMTPEDLDARAGPIEQQQQAGPIAQISDRPASEATKVEQHRAAAEVHAAVAIAQSSPRDPVTASRRVQEACDVMALAEHAFFSFGRGDGKITGPSIHLATELARCWGNILFGVNELSREGNQSEMLTYAWDLETNTRNVSTFIVPHVRDTKGGPKKLTSMRDIYENNANAGARRLRENIFRVLPKSIVELGKEGCARTLESGGGVPIEDRRKTLVSAFAGINVGTEQIEKRVGCKIDALTGLDIARLRIVYQSIKRGETTAKDEFATDAAADITKELTDKKQQAGKKAPAAKKTPAAKKAADPEPQEVAVDVSAESSDQPSSSSNDPDSDSPTSEPPGTFELPGLSITPTLEEIEALRDALPRYMVGKSISELEALLEEMDPTIFSILHVDQGAAGEIENLIKAEIETRTG